MMLRYCAFLCDIPMEHRRAVTTYVYRVGNHQRVDQSGPHECYLSL